MHVVFDFDRTLTVSRPGINGDITTWHIFNEHLPPTGQDRYQKLFAHYRPLELNGTMDETHATVWWTEILNLFAEYKINLYEIEQDFLSKATIRPYAKELFDLCAARNIPTVILSAGIKDIIEIWALNYLIRPSVIHSTSLHMQPDGTISGWDKESIVHVLNKKERGDSHDDIADIRRRRPMTILVGDSLNDASMAEGDETVFRVLIHDPRPNDSEVDTSAFRERAFQKFDAILESGSLRPVGKLIENL